MAKPSHPDTTATNALEHPAGTTITARKATVWHTPDGRYLVVRGRLWRQSNPNLTPHERQQAVQQLMAARRAVKHAMAEGDAIALAQARQGVDAAKHALGERGPVWWTDGAPDYNRHLAKNTPYAAWWAAVDVAHSAALKA